MVWPYCYIFFIKNGNDANHFKKRNYIMENKAGRPAIFADKNAIVVALRAIKGEEKVAVSRFLKLQLAERGLIVAQDVKSGGRGRPAKNYVLTGKGKTYLNFSKNWK
jgi:hypothetical protein